MWKIPRVDFPNSSGHVEEAPREKHQVSEPLKVFLSINYRHHSTMRRPSICLCEVCIKLQV